MKEKLGVDSKLLKVERAPSRKTSLISPMETILACIKYCWWCWWLIKVHHYNLGLLSVLHSKLLKVERAPFKENKSDLPYGDNTVLYKILLMMLMT